VFDQPLMLGRPNITTDWSIALERSANGQSSTVSSYSFIKMTAPLTREVRTNDQSNTELIEWRRR
jgi:hypothetical protein